MIHDRNTLTSTPARELALDCLQAGIEAADPARAVRERVTVADRQLKIGPAVYDLDAFDDVLVVGGGKATGRVVSALSDLLADQLSGGVIVTDTATEIAGVETIVGDHPIPSERGESGARRVLERAERAGGDTLVLAVLTGGGSALLPAPAGDIALDDLQRVTDALLSAGATIDEINAVRKHCSAIKGGRLAAAAAPATVVGLLVSDVVGDDPSVIASGPTVPDSTTYADAVAVLDRYEIDAPTVRSHLDAGRRGERSETPGPGDPVFDGVETVSLADAWTALDAARDVASEAGYEPLVLSSRVRGEARETALTHVAVAEEIAATGHPIDPPAIVLSGGEATVTVTGDGSGGPNQEFALAAAIEQADSDLLADAVVAAVDTDGIDGASDVAGAIVDGETVEDAAAAKSALDDNDAGGYFGTRDALIETGPTGTNVNDLRVLVVQANR